MGEERRRVEEGVCGVGKESGGGNVWGGRGGEWRRKCVWGVGEEKESGGGDGRSAGCRREEDRGVQGECKKDERNMGHKESARVCGREICLVPKLLGVR